MMDTNKNALYDFMEMCRQQTESKARLLANKSKSVMSTNIDFDENFIRRERRRRQETEREINKMKAELPVYNLNDIRHFKLPFHEALILELEETNYVSTEAYIKQLFELNERLRHEAGPQNMIWSTPLLKNSDQLLKKLSDALVKAEDEHRKGNFRTDVEILLRVSIDVAINYYEWFWLAEELLLQCIDSARKYKVTGKHEAISRYIYGKILMEMAKDYEKAKQELNITRDLSIGKSWNVKAFLPDHSDSSTLFMNANSLLYSCYIREAKHYQKIDLHKALEYATLAKKRAVEACHHDGETMALFIKGQCELALGNTKDAVSTFNKAYYIQAKLKSKKGMCEARVELSKAYLMHGSTRLALNTLLALKAMAEEHGFQFYLAQAYRYLGEYYLNCGEPHKATPLLSDALAIFYETGNISEANQVRNLGALSSGLELMPLYISLLQRTDKRCPEWYENLIRMVRWKDSREQFWVDLAERVSGAGHLSKTINSMGWDDYLHASMAVDPNRDDGTQCSEFDVLSRIFEPNVSSSEEELITSQILLAETEDIDEAETEFVE